VADNNPTGALAEIRDVGQISFPDPSELKDRIVSFLASNELLPEDIDTLLLGFNGDQRSDFWYSDLQTALFPSQSVFSFKNLVGEYPTVSAFAVWMATMLLAGKKCPPETLYKKGSRTPQNVLIYNRSSDNQHGFILMRKVL
jgi:hypothetical protein